MQKILVLYLIIYFSFSFDVFAQNLKLKIDGKSENETLIIDSLNYTKNHKDYNSIKIEVDTLKKKLYRIGYFNLKGQSISKSSDSTFSVLIDLKQKFRMIQIYYDTLSIDKEILKGVSDLVNDQYFIIPIERIEQALFHINSKISEKGFPFNTIKLSDIEIKDNNTIHSKLVSSSKSDKRTIDNIIIKGYEKFPKSYLKRFLKIKTTEIFDLSLIKQKTELINNLNFAKQIKNPEVLFTKDSTTLYLYLEKTKSNAFDGYLGFGTNDKTNNIEFNGYLDLQLNNNLNYGESFGLQYKSEENEQKNFNIKLNLPYLFKTALGTEIELNIFKKDSSFTTVNQNAKLFYQLNSKSKLFVGIKSIVSNNLLDSETSPTTIMDYETTFYSLRYNYMKRQYNNALFPTNMLFDIEIGTGKRSVSNISEKQALLNFDFFKLVNLNKKNSVFLRFNGFSLISDDYLENELYRFGGINSIRGFEENSLEASLQGLINTEYRYLLNKSIYVHSIIDVAYFENDIIDQKEKLFGFGLGFGVLTKAGLLKFNYANGKNENQKFKLSNSKIHLSLSAFF